MKHKDDIAGYVRISFDDDLNNDNTSIENQMAMIEDYVKRNFPDAKLTFYNDRDRSGYTFEKREGYQEMRKNFVEQKHNILIIKDFSRFSRRNGRGLVELEDLRDMGLRIISIGDGIDYPTNDDWIQIQMHFFLNEMPVTDTSKKVKNVIKHRQQEGEWICAVPYGYTMINSKKMEFEVNEAAAEVVRMVFDLYNKGWGYKKIANHLTDLHIPTPRMVERERKEAKGEECKLSVRPEWSIITIQKILDNDFYIGTLRQRKFTRKKINGDDRKLDTEEHIVFENHHAAIVDYSVFALAQENRKKRTTTHYRGIKINDNVYSGYLFCGECGSPMFSRGKKNLRPNYICGLYHRRGLRGCTAHHIRVDILDALLKSYIQKVKENSADMIEKLEQSIKEEKQSVQSAESLSERLYEMLEQAKAELKATKRQKIKEIMKRPEQEELIEETYNEMELDLEHKIAGLQNQISMSFDKRNTIIQVNRIAKTAMDIFDDILQKTNLDKVDIGLIVEKITVFDDGEDMEGNSLSHVEIQLKSDIDMLLSAGELEEIVNFPHDTEHSAYNTIVQSASKQKDKVFRVNVINGGDPLEIFTNREGEVIFKKYSPIGELGEFASHYAETLSKTSGHPVCITDKDSIVAIYGAPKKEFMEKRISSELEKIMDEKSTFIMKMGDTKTMPVMEGADKYVAGVVAPIISEGSAIGSVIMVKGEERDNMGEVETKLAQSAAGVLGKQMEE